MKPMVSELVANEECVSYFFIPEPPQIRRSKKDKEYLCLKLQDKTGIVEGRMWDIPPNLVVSELTRGSFVKVRAQVGEWNDALQLSISQLRLAEESDGIDVGDFFERSERDPREMWDELWDLLFSSLKNKFIAELVRAMLTSNREDFCKAPAAKSIHHNYIGGLLEHVLSLCKTAVLVSERYGLDEDLMLAACVLHDVGKLRELSYDLGIAYTVEGTLVGHISIGMMEVSKTIDGIPEFPTNLKMAVMHLMASHHGSLAWGSPRIPLMREAIGFHLCDLLDSRMAICDRAARKGFDERGLTEWVRELEGPLWRGPWQEDSPSV